MSGSFAERDLQLKLPYASSPSRAISAQEPNTLAGVQESQPCVHRLRFCLLKFLKSQLTTKLPMRDDYTAVVDISQRSTRC